MFFLIRRRVVIIILLVSQEYAGIGCSVRADSLNVNKAYVISSIDLIGNKVTKDKVILRELTFKTNDTLYSNNLMSVFERNHENLLKMSLFNYVYFDTIVEHANNLKVKIIFEERWYTWPEIHFNHADRNFSAWWKSKDFSRANYGLGITLYNFRGRNEKLSIRGITGFKTQLAITYNYIYLDEKRRHSFDFESFFEIRNKLEFATENNEQQVIKTDKSIFQKQNYFIKYNYRPKLYNIHEFVISYYNYKISDTVVAINTNFLGESRNKQDYFTFIYSFENDHRDLKYYPLLGSYFNFQLAYSGLFHKEVNKFEISAAYYKFFKIYKRTFASIGCRTQLANKLRQPYVLTRGLGYYYYLRGYENYVIDGNNFWLLKTSFKYQVLPVKIIKLNFIPFEKFNKIHISAFINLFFDAGYAHDYYSYYKLYGNSLVNKALYSFGMGIDLVTYYDKMFRADLARNGLGEWGIFLSFTQDF